MLMSSELSHCFTYLHCNLCLKFGYIRAKAYNLNSCTQSTGTYIFPGSEPQGLCKSYGASPHPIVHIGRLPP